MSSWSEDDLRAIAENADLFVSPFREDGTTYGTPTRTWASSSAVTSTFEPAGDGVSDAIDAAYEATNPGSSAVPIVQADGPKSATVRILPR
jgi:hypothetical protein